MIWYGLWEAPKGSLVWKWPTGLAQATETWSSFLYLQAPSPDPGGQASWRDLHTHAQKENYKMLALYTKQLY